MNGDNYVENTAFELALVNGSGTSSRTGGAIDCEGFNNLCFVLQLHAIAGGAVASASVEESDSKDGPWTAVPGASIDYGAGGWRVIEIRNPGKQWQRLAITKDNTNATEESAMALRGNSRNYPVGQPSGQTLWLNGP